MCDCPAHKELSDCNCQCDHTNDRLRQWRERAERAELHVAGAESEINDLTAALETAEKGLAGAVTLLNLRTQELKRLTNSDS